MAGKSNDDCQIITPAVSRNLAAKAVVPGTPGIDYAAIERAEKALEALSHNFGDWMQDECAELQVRWAALSKEGPGKAQVESLFHSAHDIKGEAPTLGFPLAADAAKSLCALLSFVSESNQEGALPMALVEQHVDAIRAIVREQGQGSDNQVAQILVQELAVAAEAFIDVHTQD